MRISADLSGIEAFVGSVAGILEAIESTDYENDFIGDMMNNLRTRFMTDSIAANEAGRANISHAFEWPAQDSRGVSSRTPSSQPLFTLLKRGTGNTRYLSYKFIPSTKPVPLPNPAEYGFKPEKLHFLRRHVFRFKALIMETNSEVVIAPRSSRKLFIPDAQNRYGYYMTSKPKTINPGGAHSTGGFSEWWMTWFESRAQAYVQESTTLHEAFIAKTSQIIIRDAATGRFATGKKVAFGYVDAYKRAAQMKMQAAAKTRYGENL